MRYKTLTSFIWHFVRRQRGVFFIIFLVSFLWALDQTVWPYLLQIVIDILTRFENERFAAWSILKVPVFWGLVLWISVEVGFRLQGFLLAYAVPKLEAEIRMAMFDHVQRHSPKYFNEKFAGSLANKVTDMVTQVTLILQQLLTLFLPAFAACILAIFFFAKISPLFAAVLGMLVFFHFGTCFWFAKGCDRHEHVHSEVRSTLLGKIVDSLTNNFAVNLYYRFKHEREILGNFQQLEKEKNIQVKRYIEVMRVFLSLFTFLIAGLAINALMLYYWIHGWLTTGEVAQIFNTTWNICMVIWLAGLAIPGLFQSIGIAKQALVVMKEPQDIADHPSSKPLIVTRGEIIFDNVSFQYGKKCLFQNKDVHIRGGEKVGLVGYSGAGKSTFVNLILRFYEVDTGKILIDGQKISNVTMESVRRQVALIPQDPILFHRTIKENILYGRLEATEQEIEKAADLAHCTDFIKRLPEGYHAEVGERGTKLSGGERQRIAIARAILANAPILILDEATSALDSVTEKYIQESLDWLMNKRTTIVIAHRLSTLAGMDRILVFDQGHIVEEGSHDELLALEGHYANMWQMQAGGFLPDTLPE
ncbi:MAG TPA: ABC transporter ATP-binding protein [Waddliaceae bacterium]